MTRLSSNPADSLTRRRFLKTAGALAGVSIPFLRGFQAHGFLAEHHTFRHPEDEKICRERFSLAIEENLADQPIGQVMIGIGRSFIGTPYVANTLEQSGKEKLVINLRGLDCVTFVENVLTLARCIKMGRPSFEAYTKQLQLIRYRNGTLDEYPSRLHYFTEWIIDNERKGIVHNVTRILGGVAYRKQINFMSTHRSSYRQLADDTFLQLIRKQEAALNRLSHYYIPKARITHLQKGLRDGDIIAITSSTEGLDISHTGVAIHVDGILKYLHAPLSDGVVQITKGSLSAYLESHRRQTGIMVARPLEPA